MPTIALRRGRPASGSRPPERGPHPTAYLASDTGLRFELPYAPSSVELDGIAYVYGTVDRPGREALVVPTGPGLRSLSFDALIVGGLDHQQSAEAGLSALRTLAARPHRITIGNLGSAAAYNAWRLVGYRQSDVMRQHGSNATTRATVSLSFLKAVDAVVKVGPISGGHTAPPKVAPAKGGAPRTHVVKAGDTFYALAVRFYGNGSKWPTIAKANGNPDPRRLRVGLRLTIPPAP